MRRRLAARRGIACLKRFMGEKIVGWVKKEREHLQPS
jgi:hypothetical protein